MSVLLMTDTLGAQSALHLVDLEQERRKRIARERARAQVLTEHLMALADELTESLNRAAPSRALTCPRHVRSQDKRPTLCPICALCAVRNQARPVRRSNYQP